MDYLKLAPDIDSDPEFEEAGFWATRVYELLLKVSALKDLRGRIPPEYQKPSWLNRRWGLSAADLGGIEPEQVIATGIDKLLEVGKLRREEQALVIGAWAKFYDPPKSNAERQAEFRAREKARREAEEAAARNESNGRNESNATPPHPPTSPTPPTPQHPTATGGAGVAEEKLPPGTEYPPDADGFWTFAQEERVARGLSKETKRPKGFAEWEAIARAQVGPDSLARAYQSFLDDADPNFRAKDKPMGVFVKEAVWLPRTVIPIATRRRP